MDKVVDEPVLSWVVGGWGGGWSSRSSPRTGSPAFCGADHRRGRGGSRGRGRRCDLQRQVPAVPLLWRGGAPASVHRQSGRGDITVEIPQVQFLEKVVDVPVVCNVRCMFETVQKTVEVLQLTLFDKGGRFPCCAGRRRGLVNSEGASDSVHRQSGRGDITVEIPQVQFLEKVVDVPVVCNVRCMFETVQKTVEVLQLTLFDKGGRFPCCAGRRRGLVNSEGASDSVHRQSQWTFQFSTETGTFSAGYGGDEGFFRLFYAPPGRLELSASFRSPRWRRVLCHRGLPVPTSTGRC